MRNWLKSVPGLQQYAGQAVDRGPKAKAYANEFIKVHLAGVGLLLGFVAHRRQAERTERIRTAAAGRQPVPAV